MIEPKNWTTRYLSFSNNVWTFIPVAVALNLGVGTVIQAVKIPLFLDSIGTVVMAILAGPAPAVLTAIITILLGGILVNPVLPWFAATAVAIGWFSGYVAGRGAFKKVWTTALYGLVLGVITAAVSAPVIVGLFGGITPAGTSVIVAYLVATGQKIFDSVILAGFACEPLDKMATFLIARSLLLGIPRRLRALYPHGDQNLS